MTVTFGISEVFLSLQGEGPSAGTPAHFVRLQGCDIGCHWCDTKYSWPAAAGTRLDLEAVWAATRALGEAPMVVITGGEPLQHPGVADLLAGAVARWPRVEVETSGIAAPPISHPRLHYNISPKLPSATPRWTETWAATAAWAAEPRAWFKLVIAAPPDADAALRLIAEHRLPRERVLLMPQGMTEAAVREQALAVAEICRREGLRLGPRLHVWLWGARRGV